METEACKGYIRWPNNTRRRMICSQTENTLFSIFICFLLKVSVETWAIKYPPTRPSSTANKKRRNGKLHLEEKKKKYFVPIERC